MCSRRQNTTAHRMNPALGSERLGTARQPLPHFQIRHQRIRSTAAQRTRICPHRVTLFRAHSIHHLLITVESRMHGAIRESVLHSSCHAAIESQRCLPTAHLVSIDSALRPLSTRLGALAPSLSTVAHPASHSYVLVWRKSIKPNGFRTLTAYLSHTTVVLQWRTWLRF